jgi:hypothetical protein
VTKDLNGMPIWDLYGSPVDVAPIRAVTGALIALESPEPPKKEPTPPSPSALVLARDDVAGDELDLATAMF